MKRMMLIAVILLSAAGMQAIVSTTATATKQAYTPFVSGKTATQQAQAPVYTQQPATSQTTQRPSWYGLVSPDAPATQNRYYLD